MENNHKTNNFFFVVTGLQLLNSIEFIFKNSLQEQNNILVMCNKSIKSRRELTMLSSMIKWNQIIELPPKRLFIRNYPNLTYLITLIYNIVRVKRINFNNSVIVGNDINPFFRFASKQNGLNEIVFIDDGSGTLSYSKDNPYNGLKQFKNKLIYHLLSVKKHEISPTIYFTTFPKVFKNVLNGTVIHNNFGFLKNSFSESNNNGKIYFVGDPHVERGYLNIQQYLEILAVVNNYFDEELVYVARANEELKKLEIINEFYNVRRNDVPLEYDIISSKSIPKAMVAFHSTVLFNMNNFLTNKVELYFIKMPKFSNKPNFDHLEKLWTELDVFATEIKLKSQSEI